MLPGTRCSRYKAIKAEWAFRVTSRQDCLSGYFQCLIAELLLQQVQVCLCLIVVDMGKSLRHVESTGTKRNHQGASVPLIHWASAPPSSPPLRLYGPCLRTGDPSDQYFSDRSLCG